MGSMGKDIYKTLKRSISGVKSSNEQQSAGQSSSSSNVKYGGGSGSTWIHPPDVLINGRVEYTVRFLGTTEVPKARGADVVRDAIHAINFQRDVKRPEVSHSSAKLQKVDIQISIDNVIVSDTKTRAVLHSYPLAKISFCADDKQDKRVFSFIAKSDGDSQKHDCFVFISEKLAEQITLTIGEAFDLAYKRFLDKNRTSLETQKQMFIYRKRIAELEAENQVLSQRLAEAIRAQRGPNAPRSLMDEVVGMTPSLPTSPMPPAPPKNLSPEIYAEPRETDLYVPTTQAPVLNESTSPCQVSPSGPAPDLPPPRAPALAPPPPVAPRRGLLARKSTTSLEEKPEVVFDDDFDPRAEEKPTTSTAKMDLTTSTAKLDPTTADDFQAMIDKVDKKLAAMNSSDFSFAKLETGKLSPGEIGVLEESDYGTPTDKLNPQVMNLKQ